MSEKVKCIALDLDGTLLSDGKGVSQENKRALRRAMDQGVHVVIASGRAYTSLPRELLEIPGIEYAITSNGAKVYRISTNECLRVTRMTPKSVRKIRRIVQGMQVTEEIFLDGQPYAPAAYVENPQAYGIFKGAVPYIQNTRIPVGDVDAFFEQHENELECLDYILKNPQEREKIWKLLEEEVEDIYVTSSMQNRLEISHRDAGKSRAYAWLLGELGVPASQAAAFGDGDNDWEMLAMSGYGIAMGNATEKCKSAAFAVTKTNEESGVAYAFSEFLDI